MLTSFHFVNANVEQLLLIVHSSQVQLKRGTPYQNTNLVRRLFVRAWVRGCQNTYDHADTLYHSIQQITFELLFHILTLISCYLVDDPRTWRTVCLKCNIDRSACHSTINLLILITVTVVLLRFDDFFPVSPL